MLTMLTATPYAALTVVLNDLERFNLACTVDAPYSSSTGKILGERDLQDGMDHGALLQRLCLRQILPVRLLATSFRYDERADDTSAQLAILCLDRGIGEEQSCIAWVTLYLQL